MKTSPGKWTKYRLMKEDEKLALYLPETVLFSKRSLYKMVDKFSQIVFKPCMGYQGKGVILITSLEEDEYELHEEINKTRLKGGNELYKYLDGIKNRKGAHILQHTIKLAVINGNPFDLRVMVQRKKNSLVWEVTGKIVRVAAKGFFITNAAKELLTVEEAIDTYSLKKRTFNDLICEIEEIALVTARRLEKYYTKRRVIGIDIVMDKEEKIWIIEANLQPGIKLFSSLKDQGMYNRIKEYFGI